MSILTRLDERGAHELLPRVREECGGPFATPLVGSSRVCSVCAAPKSRGYDTCYRCGRDRRAHGDRLADLVVPLTYAIKPGAGARRMHIYKSPQPATPDQRTRLSAELGRLLRVGLGLHRRCIETRLGHEITAWSVVPSTTGRPIEPHPLRAIATTGGLNGAAARLRLANADVPAHVLVENLFRAEGDVDGHTVLVLDDTWVTGSRAQAAALALRRAGAARVVIVVLSRWLNTEHPGDAALARRIDGDYEPTVCPAGWCTTPAE